MDIAQVSIGAPDLKLGLEGQRPRITNTLDLETIGLGPAGQGAIRPRSSGPRGRRVSGPWLWQFPKTTEQLLVGHGGEVEVATDRSAKRSTSRLCVSAASPGHSYQRYSNRNPFGPWACLRPRACLMS